MRRSLPALAMMCLCFHCAAQSARTPYAPDWKSLDGRPAPAWFNEARFGVFVCWGPYCVPGYAPKGAYAEWYGHEINNPNSPQAAFHARVYGKDFPYRNFGKMMTGELFDPEEWSDLFLKSGARYVILSANYHDGFSMWPNPYAPGWNCMDTGPHRDILGDLSQSVRKRGMRMGIYFSLYEWYHPLWLTNRQRYVTEHFQPQFKDVVARYKPSLIFADGEWEADDKLWRSEELLAWLFNDSPVKDEVAVNDRWGNSRGKHGTFYESEYGGGNMVPSHPWQEDRGMGKSYGYNRNESVDDYDSDTDLIRMLCRCAGNGGNLLLCVGPTADGRIPNIMQERLIEIGGWLKTNGEAIYGTQASPFWPRKFSWGTVTRRPGRLYLHLYGHPNGAILLPGLKNSITHASFLGYPSLKPLTIRKSSQGPRIEMPSRLPDPRVSVVVVDIEGEPQVDLAINPQANGDIILDAADAIVHGTSPQLEYKHPNGNIGFWGNPVDTVGWTYRLRKPGTYEVTITASCEQEAAGSQFTLRSGANTLTASTVSTGGWDRFSSRKIGTIRLEKSGQHELTIAPETPPAWKSMGLARIILHRIK